MEGREACIMPANPGIHQSMKLCHGVEKKATWLCVSAYTRVTVAPAGVFSAGSHGARS